MRKFITLVFAALAIVFANNGQAGITNSPVGIWDVNYNSTIKITLGDKTYRPIKLKNGYDILQFTEDGKAVSFLHWYDSPGSWTPVTQGAKRFNLAYDVNAINNTASIVDYGINLAQQFFNFYKKQFNKSPTVTDIKFTEYSEKMSLVNRGLMLSGRTTLKATVDYKEPDTNLAKQATLSVVYTSSGFRFSAPSTCCSASDATQNLAASNEFLKANAKLPGVIKARSKSGLQYRRFSVGEGVRPLPTDTVKVNYRGMLPSGEIFDANSGIRFKLNQVIEGWTEGLQLMREKSFFRFFIPPNLAYGETGAGSDIKPNTALIFDVYLDKVCATISADNPDTQCRP